MYIVFIRVKVLSGESECKISILIFSFKFTLYDSLTNKKSAHKRIFAGIGESISGT